MIRHIVLFTLTEKARQEGVVEMLRSSAESMLGKIPGLLTVELNLNRAQNSPHDLIFYSEFEDLQSLEAYQTHPLHEAHKQLASEYVSNPETADPFS